MDRNDVTVWVLKPQGNGWMLYVRRKLYANDTPHKWLRFKWQARLYVRHMRKPEIIL